MSAGLPAAAALGTASVVVARDLHREVVVRDGTVSTLTGTQP